MHKKERPRAFFFIKGDITWRNTPALAGGPQKRPGKTA